jgi:hypothetical protein
VVGGEEEAAPESADAPAEPNAGEPADGDGAAPEPAAAETADAAADTAVS